jgi:hypothetical protein
MAVDSESASMGWELLKGGSLLAFAAAVLWELRQQRTERNQHNKVINALLGDLNSAMAILLDRAGIKMRKQTHPLGIPTVEGESES